MLLNPPLPPPKTPMTLMCPTLNVSFFVFYLHPLLRTAQSLDPQAGAQIPTVANMNIYSENVGAKKKTNNNRETPLGGMKRKENENPPEAPGGKN